MKTNIFKKLHRQNSGAGMVAVLVCIAVFALLGIAILSMTYTGMKIKTTARRAAENFSYAEQAMEGIRSGIELAASNAIAEASDTIYRKYATYKDQAAIDTKFKDEFIKKFRATEMEIGTPAAKKYLFTQGNSTTLQYTGTTEDIIKYYIKSSAEVGSVLDSIDNTTNTNWTIDVPQNTLVNVPNVTAGTDVLYITLPEITVTYTDARGAISEVKSGFKIRVPSFSYLQSTNRRGDIKDFSVLTNGDLLLESGAKIYSDKKNVRAQSLSFGAGTVHLSKGEFYFGYAGNENYVPAPAAATTATKKFSGIHQKDGATGGSLYFESGSTVYADRVVNKDATMDMAGELNIADDLELNGSGTTKIKGILNGFGNDTANSSKSSALVVNGQGAKLDVSTGAVIQMAGYAFLSRQSETATGDVATRDYITGESLTVQGNQLMYLIPTDNLNPAKVQSNPHIGTPVQLTDNDRHGNWREYLEKYGITDVQNNTSTVGIKSFTPQVAAGQEQVTYYFFDFTPAQAATFAKNYLAQHPQSTAPFLEKYTNNAKAQLRANGAVIRDQSGALDTNTTTPKAQSTAVNQYKIDLQKMTFDNIVKATINGDLHFGEDAKVINKDYTIPADEKASIIVCTGKVTVASKYDGVIIAKGDIVVNSGVELNKTLDEKKISDALAATRDGTTFENYIYNIIDTAKSDDSNFNLSKFVAFDNWTKDGDWVQP